MKYIKLFEYWSTEGNQYLINKDTENGGLVREYIRYFDLSSMVMDIWNFGKNELGIYPDKITHQEILYISTDGCKVIIKLENKVVTTISKIKIEYSNGSFKPKVIDSGDFSFDKFKYYLSKPKQL
jgi:hypothetical protein